MSKSKKAKPKQLELFELKKYSRVFGGLLLQNRRRAMRPLSTHEALHVVLRSSWANGRYSMLRFGRTKNISKIIESTAKRYGVTIYALAVCGNHIHCLVRFSQRVLYKNFIRVSTGRIAELVMGTTYKEFRQIHPNPQTTEPQGIGQRFFQYRPFTRVVHWGRDYKFCKAYIGQNILEALGFVPFRPRKDRYRSWVESGYKT